MFNPNHYKSQRTETAAILNAPVPTERQAAFRVQASDGEMTEQAGENCDPHPVVIEKSPETGIPVTIADHRQLPANREDLVVQRILVRHGVSRDLAVLLLDDMRRTLAFFERHPIHASLSAEEASSFKH